MARFNALPANRRLRLSGLAMALFMAAGLAQAARPANLAGTIWSARINQTVETLTINTQSGPGIPGGPDCVIVNGTIGIAPVTGHYCQASGAITLVHENIATHRAMRVFTAHLADDVAGQPYRMTGTVHVMNAAFGQLGAYNFAAHD